ncbi:hypothetical protein LTR85_010654 [Meristemomyces frigidus]|nr:hypothetical protein LTR85_010654 [Meristemomyces frigidus]
MAAVNLPANYSPEPDFDPDNNIDWEMDELMSQYPRQLLGSNLVRFAEYYNNEELMAQANVHRKSEYTPNNFTHLLTDTIDEHAIASGQEPDRFRDAFNIRRAANIKETGLKTWSMAAKAFTMPDNIAVLPLDSSLQDLGAARTAFLQHTNAGHRLPSEYWVKLNTASQGVSLAEFAAALGFDNHASARNHMKIAKARGPRLAPILANMTTAPPTAVQPSGTTAHPQASSSVLPTTSVASASKGTAKQTSKKRVKPAKAGKRKEADHEEASSPSSSSTPAYTSAEPPVTALTSQTDAIEPPKKKAKTVLQPLSTSTQPSAPHTVTIAVEKVSENIRTALAIKADALSKTLETAHEHPALNLSAMTESIEPWSESGEDFQSVHGYVTACGSLSLRFYKKAEIRDHVACFIRVWLERSERSTFLKELQESLNLFDGAMEVSVVAE